MRKKILAVVLSLVLAFGFMATIDYESASARTMADDAKTKLVFGEYDSFVLQQNEITTIKVVFPSDGTFVIDFTPKKYYYTNWELYDPQGNLLYKTDYYGISSFEMNKEQKAGTYYLRVWSTSGDYKDPVDAAYFGRFIPSKEAKVNIAISLKKKGTVQLVDLLENIDDKKITWTSDNKKVATVSSNGTVKAKKKGTATISLISQSTGIVAKIKVTVK